MCSVSVWFLFFFFQAEDGIRGNSRVSQGYYRGGYFDHTAQSMGADFRREAITMLEAMGISVEFSHHEGGPGQQGIDLRYADALRTADNLMSFRTVIRAFEPRQAPTPHAP